MVGSVNSVMLAENCREETRSPRSPIVLLNVRRCVYMLLADSLGYGLDMVDWKCCQV